MPRYGMVIDLKSCVGCYSCVMACKAENATPAHTFWNRVIAKEEGKYPAARLTYTPVSCMHCENPSCVNVCPTGASYKRQDGIVMVDDKKCIGCGYCVNACPYDARILLHKYEGSYPKFGLTEYEQQGSSKHSEGTVEKCTFCVHRVDKGLEPACVKTCPAKARHFGDLSDPNSEPSRLLAEREGTVLLEHLGTKPKVYYVK